MQIGVFIMLHATQINYILQKNAPANTTLPGFSRKRAVFNIWEHGPPFHIFMWSETLVCIWKLYFYNILSTLINANAGAKVELLLLYKDWHTHPSHFSSCFFFLVISILIAGWKGEIAPTAADTVLAECLFYGSTPLFGWAGCLFSAHLGASWAHGLQRDNTGNCMDHFIVLSCLFTYVGLSLSLTFQRSLFLRTLCILVIE